MLASLNHQVGKFMLPAPGKPVIYNDDKEMYWHIGEDDVSFIDRRESMYTDFTDSGTLATASDVPRRRCPVRYSS